MIRLSHFLAASVPSRLPKPESQKNRELLLGCQPQVPRKAGPTLCLNIGVSRPLPVCTADVRSCPQLSDETGVLGTRPTFKEVLPEEVACSFGLGTVDDLRTTASQ